MRTSQVHKAMKMAIRAMAKGCIVTETFFILKFLLEGFPYFNVTGK